VSTRWSQVAGADSGDAYARRFAALAATGQDVHGEATFCASLVEPGARVLDAGCGHGRVTIELARRGYDVVGLDIDDSMLDLAKRTAPDVRWVRADLAQLDPRALGLEGGFDLVVAAGNVIPLLAPGTEPMVLANLTACLRARGQLVAGFGLDPSHLPLDDAPVTLADYDAWCTAAGTTFERRYATWQGAPYAHGAYAVSVHVLRDK